jgi:hypothetical protein
MASRLGRRDESGVIDSLRIGGRTWETMCMDTPYPPKQFGHLIGRSVNTLQKWDRKGILQAHRRPTTRRSYSTHDQYLAS